MARSGTVLVAIVLVLLPFPSGAGSAARTGFQEELAGTAPFDLEEATIDYLDTIMGGGFKIDRLRNLPPNLSGPVVEKIHEIIEKQINPAVASHGGYISLIDVKDNVVYVQLGGGCQGCGMADVTLKQGIEAMIKEAVPEIARVYDVTDHANGKNPYYQPSK